MTAVQFALAGGLLGVLAALLVVFISDRVLAAFVRLRTTRARCGRCGRQSEGLLVREGGIEPSIHCDYCGNTWNIWPDVLDEGVVGTPVTGPAVKRTLDALDTVRDD